MLANSGLITAPCGVPPVGVHRFHFLHDVLLQKSFASAQALAHR